MQNRFDCSFVLCTANTDVWIWVAPWACSPASLFVFLFSDNKSLKYKLLSLGCVRNSSSAAVERSRGTIGGVEPVNHPALASPRPLTGEHQPIQWGTWQGEKPLQDSQRNEPLPMHPPGLSQYGQQSQRCNWGAQHHGSMGEAVWSTSGSEGYGARYGMRARPFGDCTYCRTSAGNEDKEIKRSSYLLAWYS